MRVGQREGLKLGDLLGITEDTSIGATLGSSDGLNDGTEVGCCVARGIGTKNFSLVSPVGRVVSYGRLVGSRETSRTEVSEDDVGTGICGFGATEGDGRLEPSPSSWESDGRLGEISLV